MSTICKLFGMGLNEESVAYVARLLNELLDEPVAVINKTLDHKLITWQTYDLFTLHQPVEMGGEVIKLKLNLEYLRITREFVVNPYLEF